MDNVFYCYVDIMNVRMKAFFDRVKFEEIRKNPKGGKLEMYFKELPEVNKVIIEEKNIVSIEEVAIKDIPAKARIVEEVVIKKGKRK